MATSDTIAATHDHETTRIRQSPPVTLKFDASSSPMSSLSSMPSPESTRQKTTTQAKTPNFITRDQALAQQHRVIQGPSLFSTSNGQREPRPAPIPRDAVIVRSDLNADAREFCEKLRLESPKICLKVFAPFDIRTFFDEYDFERLGGEFLYETLILLWKENGKRVVDFCQNWALKNEEAFHHWFDGKCDVETLFAKADQEEYGYDFLDKALMCMKECYEAAGEQRVTESVGGNAYQHNHYVLTQMEQHEGSAFQVQNTNVNNAYVANQNHANARYASSYADQHAGYQNGFVQPPSQPGNNKKSPKKKGSKSHARANADSDEYSRHQQPGPYGPASTQPMVSHHAANPGMMPLSMSRLPSMPGHLQPHIGGAPGVRPMYPPPPLSGAAHGFEPQRGYYQTARPPPEHVHTSYPEVPPPAIDRNGSMRGRGGRGYAGQCGGFRATGTYRRSSLGQSGDGNDARDEVETRRFTAHPEFGQDRDFEVLRKTMSHPMVATPWVELEPTLENDAQMRRPSNFPGQRIESRPAESHGHIVDSNGSDRGSAPTRQLGASGRDRSSSDSHSISDHRPRDPLEVWIGSIPEDCAEEDLYAVLSQHAEVTRLNCIRREGKCTIAFARLASDGDVRKILQSPQIVFHESELMIRRSRSSEFKGIRPALRTPPQQAYKGNAARSRQTSVGSGDVSTVETNAPRYSPQDARSSADSSPRCDTTVPVLKSWANIASKAPAIEPGPLASLPSVPDKTTQKHKENVTPSENSAVQAEETSSKTGKRDESGRRRKEKTPVIRMPPAVSKTLSVIGEAEEPATPKFSTMLVDKSDESAVVPDGSTTAVPPIEDTKASRSGSITLDIPGVAGQGLGVSKNKENVIPDVEPDSAITLQSPVIKATENEELATLDVKSDHTDVLAQGMQGDGEAATALPTAASKMVPTEDIDLELERARSLSGREVPPVEQSEQASVVAQPEGRLETLSHSVSPEQPVAVSGLLTSSGNDASVVTPPVDEPRSAVPLTSHDSRSADRVLDRDSLIDIAHLRQRLTKVGAIKAQESEAEEHLAQVEKCKKTVDNLESREKEIMGTTNSHSSKTVNKKRNQKIKKLTEDYNHVLDEIEFIWKFDKEPEQKESKDKEVSSSYPPVNAAEATFRTSSQPDVEAAEYIPRLSSYPAFNAAEATLRPHPATERIDRDGAQARMTGVPLMADGAEGSQHNNTAGRMAHVWNNMGEVDFGNRGKGKARIASGIPDSDLFARYDQQSMLNRFPHRTGRVDSPLTTSQQTSSKPVGLGISGGSGWPRIVPTDAASTEGTVSPVSPPRGPVKAQNSDAADTEHAAELHERLEKLGASNAANTPRHMAAAITSPPKSPGPHSYARAASSTNLTAVLAAAESSVSSAGAGLKRKIPNVMAAESSEHNVLDKGKQKAEDDWKASEEWGPGGFRKQGGGDRIAGEDDDEVQRPKSKKKGKAKVKVEGMVTGEQRKGG